MESDEVAPLQKKRSRKIISIPSTSSAKPDKKNIRHSKSNSKISRRSLVSKEQTPIAATRELPLVMGNTYLKVENFDLEELSVKNFFFFGNFYPFKFFNNLLYFKLDVEIEFRKICSTFRGKSTSKPSFFFFQFFFFFFFFR